MRNVYVYVEGFYDRTFSAGWLLSREWRDPGLNRDGTRSRVTNPVTGMPVNLGRFLFEAPKRNSYAEIVPMQGDRKLLDALEGALRRHLEETPICDIVVVLDLDDEDLEKGMKKRRDSLETLLRKIDSDFDEEDDHWILFSKLRVDLLLWYDRSPDKPAIPKKHCLERIIVAAISTVYPERVQAVYDWLASRPSPPPNQSPKEYTWSHMAGWFADRGCEGFLRAIWGDKNVARELNRLLSANGAQSLIERLERG